MSVAPSDHSTSIRAKLGRRGVLVSAAVAALALALSGAVAADAATTPSATVNNNIATAGGEVMLTLANYTPGETVTVKLDTASVQTSADPGYTQDTVDPTGAYVAAVFLPSTLSTGAHNLIVTGTATTTPATIPLTIWPQPTGSVTPSTVSVSAYRSAGVTVTFTGFRPNATVVFGVGNGGSGGPAGNPVTADAAGTATLHYVPAAGTQAGTYYFSAWGSEGSFVAKPVTLTVTADPAPAAPAPVAVPATPVKQTASFTG